MKNKICIVLILGLLSGICGCGAAEIRQDTGAVEQNLLEDDIEVFDKTEEQNIAYGEILWDAYYLGKIDGKEFGSPNAEGYHGAYFAIYDVDGDGEEELLLDWAGSSMATTVEYIWGYNNGTTHVELSEFPLMTYFDCGVIEVGWSHNQGLAGDFWPYSVYCYDSETDTYRNYGGVDAWDRIVSELNYDDENFPINIDVDGDGIVYYILPANWEGNYDRPVVDGADYEEWRNTYLKDAKEIDITFQNLSEENISLLGAPKSDIEFPEPAG